MGGAKYIFVLAFLGLSFLTTALCESRISELYLDSVDTVDAADRDEDAAEDEQTPAPSGPRHLLKFITRWRVDLPTLPLAARHLLPHLCSHAFGRVCHSSAAMVYQAAPFYQVLQEYRF